MYGKYFTYDGKSSQDFGMMIGSVGGGDDIPFAMTREVYQGTINRYKNRVNHMGTKWAEVLQFTISLVKDTCLYPSQNDMIFTEDEVNEINAWLTSPDYPLLFHMYDEDFVVSDEYDRVYFHKSSLVANGNNSARFIGYYFNEVFLFNNDGELVDTQITRIPIPIDDTPLETKFSDPISIEIEGDYVCLVFDHDSNELITQSCMLNGKRMSKSNSSTWSYGNDDTCRVLIKSKLDRNLKYDYFGVFSDVTPQLIDGDVVGFTLTFTTNSPFAWSPEHVVNATISGSGTIELTVDNPERYRELYPLIEIRGINTSSTPSSGDDTTGTDDDEWEEIDDWEEQTTESSEPNPSSGSGGSSGDSSNEEEESSPVREQIKIINNNDKSYIINGSQVINASRSLQIKIPHTWIYIDSERARIYDIISTVSGDVNRILSFDDLGIEDVSYIYWPRLFNGTNSWTIEGDCEVNIKWREPRKVGAY